MKKGYQVIESDIAPGSVKKVKNIAVKNNIRNGYYAIIDAENLPFNNNTIDAVFIVASLHHFPNPEKAVSEIARVLKQNSHFLILREPAAWQYILFGPIFKLFRTILRHKNKNYVSLADDEATGFSKRRFMFLLTNDFKNIKFEPVHYLSKFYDNFLILLSKFLNKNYEFNYKIKDSLQKLDKLIARIPLIKNLPWDWDVYCQKK